jgi:hypothetical protein
MNPRVNHSLIRHAGVRSFVIPNENAALHEKRGINQSAAEIPIRNIRRRALRLEGRVKAALQQLPAWTQPFQQPA